jgi:hypothetical protein
LTLTNDHPEIFNSFKLVEFEEENQARAHSQVPNHSQVQFQSQGYNEPLQPQLPAYNDSVQPKGRSFNEPFQSQVQTYAESVQPKVQAYAEPVLPQVQAYAEPGLAQAQAYDDGAMRVRCSKCPFFSSDIGLLRDHVSMTHSTKGIGDKKEGKTKRAAKRQSLEDGLSGTETAKRSKKHDRRSLPPAVAVLEGQSLQDNPELLKNVTLIKEARKFGTKSKRYWCHRVLFISRH